MGAHRISASDVRTQFPAGTALHDPVSGEYARVVEHTPERVVCERSRCPELRSRAPTSILGRRSVSRSSTVSWAIDVMPTVASFERESRSPSRRASYMTGGTPAIATCGRASP